MSRKKHEHEDHVNHEAWAIPYGDLITLLLAFFVVMYAVSSVNEGKYRVLSDSLLAAFRGQPHTFEPVPVGPTVSKVKQDDTIAGVKPNQAMKFQKWGIEEAGDKGPGLPNDEDDNRNVIAAAELRDLAQDLEIAMQTLIDKDLIRVKRSATWVEVEIKTDILFPSGSSEISPPAVEILDKLAAILADRKNTLRVEGHTDNVPIKTAKFPSNWELSAARAARIVRQFQGEGIGPDRMTVAGLADQRPVGDNKTPDGRNQNRRVALVILGDTPKPAEPKEPPAAAEAPLPTDPAAVIAPVTAPAEMAKAAEASEPPAGLAAILPPPANPDTPDSAKPPGVTP